MANMEPNTTAAKPTRAQMEQTAMERITGIRPDPAPPPKPAIEGDAAAEGQIEELEQGESLDAQVDETGEQQESAAELEEVDFDDFKLPVPKTHAQKVRDILLQKAAYTRGNQEVAEARRALTAKERLLGEQQAFHQAAIDDIAMIRGIDAQISQYGNVNWQGMDTDTLVRTKHQLDQLKDARATAERSLQAKAQEFRGKRETNLRELAKAGYNQVTQKVSGFNETAAKEVREYAEREGYTPEEIAALYDPRVVIFAYKAMKYDQLQAGKPNITKRANEAPPVLKPGASIKRTNADEALTANFRKAKSPREKLRIGEDILARKMRI